MSMQNEDTFLSNPISEEETANAVRSLKKKKAGGWDGIVAEHFQYGGVATIKAITWILNSIVITEHIPKSFKYGIAIPIYKHGKDDRLNRDNYRKITLLTTMCKLFESVTLARADPWLLEEQRLGSLQGAAEPGCSCLNTTFLLRETAVYQQEGGHNVFIALLDARKAFDSVWIKGLLHKIYKLGINGKLWRLLLNWYSDLRCKVRIGSSYSDEFALGQGVFQGGKWSMRLFQIFYRDLLLKLIHSNKGCNIYSTRAVCPTYADDLSLAAPFQTTLQNLLTQVYEYACKWRIEFNATKSALIKLPHSMEKTSNECSLGRANITCRDTVEHLGTLIGNEDAVVARIITKGNKCFNSMLSIGSRTGGLNPVIGSKLYWTAVIPAMLYGVEVLSLSNKAIEKIEQQHRTFAKRLQQISSKTPNPLAYTTLGWQSIHSYVSQKTLQFIHGMLLCKTDSVYRSVCIDRLTDIIGQLPEGPIHTNSPIKWFVQACLKYGLLDDVKEMIDSGETVSKEEWKKMCKVRTSSHEHVMIYAERLLYSKLGYTTGTNIMDTWWKVAFHYPNYLHACRFMIKCKIGVEPLQCNIGAYNKEGDKAENKLCPLCLAEEENVQHLMFRCHVLTNSRTVFHHAICRISDDGIDIIRRQSVFDVINPPMERPNFKLLGNVAQRLFDMYMERHHLIASSTSA